MRTGEIGSNSERERGAGTSYYAREPDLFCVYLPVLLLRQGTSPPFSANTS